MNKRYMSLLLLSTAVSGTKAMDLLPMKEVSDQAPAEEVKDKYAILKPRLSEGERYHLEKTIDRIGYVANPTRAELKEAYNAILQLEADQAPDARTSNILKSRRTLWTMLKDASATDKVDAKLEVDYLTGSEDEQEATDEAAKLNHLVSRVHRRDRHMKDQAVSQVAREGVQAQLKAQEEQLAKQQAALLATKQPLDASTEELAQQEADLKDQEVSAANKEAAVERVIDFAMRCIEDEPLLAETPREQLVMPIAADLAAEKADLAEKLGAIVIARQALTEKLNPVVAQLEQVAKAQEETQVKQAELTQLFEQAKIAQTLAQTDREKLLLTIDQRIEVSCENRTTITAEVAEFAKQIAGEKDAAAKAELQAQKVAKDAEVVKIAQTITNLKVARAQADGTYSRTKWLFGSYK